MLNAMRHLGFGARGGRLKRPLIPVVIGVGYTDVKFYMIDYEAASAVLLQMGAQGDYTGGFSIFNGAVGSIARVGDWTHLIASGDMPPSSTYYNLAFIDHSGGAPGYVASRQNVGGNNDYGARQGALHPRDGGSWFVNQHPHYLEVNSPTWGKVIVTHGDDAAAYAVSTAGNWLTPSRGFVSALYDTAANGERSAWSTFYLTGGDDNQAGADSFWLRTLDASYNTIATSSQLTANSSRGLIAPIGAAAAIVVEFETLFKCDFTAGGAISNITNAGAVANKWVAPLASPFWILGGDGKIYSGTGAQPGGYPLTCASWPSNIKGIGALGNTFYVISGTVPTALTVSKYVHDPSVPSVSQASQSFNLTASGNICDLNSIHL